MTEPKDYALSTNGVRIARVWTILLVALLAVNFGLVARAVTKPVRRTSPTPRVVVSIAAVAPSPAQLPANETTENAEPSSALLVAAPADVSIAVDEKARPVDWDDAEQAAHVILDPVEIEPPVAASAPDTQSNTIAKADIPPPVETPIAPPPVVPREVPQPPAPSPPAAIPQNVLILVNPPNSGGVMHYAVDNAVISLQPGEYQELDDVRERRVRFDKGEEFGTAEHRLQRGVNVFAVGETGWELRPADDNLARRMLNTCRPMTTEK